MNYLFLITITTIELLLFQREQIAQKNEKRQRSRLYKIVETASGYWFPITKGLKVCLHPPCTDESRLKLKKDETILVTRWRK